MVKTSSKWNCKYSKEYKDTKSIPKNHDQRMYKFGYDEAINKIIKLIDKISKEYSLTNGYATLEDLKKEIKKLQ